VLNIGLQIQQSHSLNYIQLHQNFAVAVVAVAVVEWFGFDMMNMVYFDFEFLVDNLAHYFASIIQILKNLLGFESQTYSIEAEKLVVEILGNYMGH